MSDGVTITLALTLKPEAVGPFCANLPAMFADTAKRKGFRDIKVVRNKENPNKVLFIENWDTEQDYNDYIAWRTERGDMEAMGGVIAAPPQMDVWPVTAASA